MYYSSADFRFPKSHSLGRELLVHFQRNSFPQIQPACECGGTGSAFISGQYAHLKISPPGVLQDQSLGQIHFQKLVLFVVVLLIFHSISKY